MDNWQQIEHRAPSGNRVLAQVREGRGQPLVLLAGTWGNAATRAPLVAALAADLRLVCVALAGQDDNWPPRRFGIPLFSEDVRSLLGTLGPARCFVAGHSLGGMIAVDLLRLCPERLAGVITLEGWPHWTVQRDAFQDDVASTLTPAQRARREQERRRLLDRWEPEQRAAFATMWREWDGRAILAATRVPVLSVWGDRGRPRPSRALLGLPAGEHVHLAWLPGVSHDLPLEAPAPVAALITRFIAAHAVAHG